MFSFDCPACKQSLSAADEQAGTTMTCPQCRETFQVPGAPAPAEAPAPPATDTEPVPAFETLPYEPDGGCPTGGLVLTLAMAVIGGVVSGWILSVIGQWFYLIVLFPMMMGGILGLIAGWAGVKLGKVRNPTAATIAALVGSCVAVVAMHFFEYQTFLNQVDNEKPGFRAFWQQAGFGLTDYVDGRAMQGVTIGRVGHGGGKGMNLGYYGSYIYWLVELGFVAGCAIAIMHHYASMPYCRDCQLWKTTRELGRFNQDPAHAVVAIGQGEIVRLAANSFDSQAGPLLLKVTTCPQCGPESTVVVELAVETLDDKGNKKMKDILKVSYPGHALPVLEALVKPAGAF